MVTNANPKALIRYTQNAQIHCLSSRLVATNKIIWSPQHDIAHRNPNPEHVLSVKTISVVLNIESTESLATLKIEHRKCLIRSVGQPKI